MSHVDAILAGDVGGTNTRLAVYALEGDLEPLLLRVYPSAQYPDLEPIIGEFLTVTREALPGVRVCRAGFGVAGPADGAVVKFTNLPWVVQTERLAKAFKLDRVLFLNDFVAICKAVPHLRSDQLMQFGGGKPVADAPRAVLGAGTGLGVGFIVPCGSGWRAVASEGGHVDFAPRGDVQLRLVQFLSTRRDGSYLENLLSGRGLENLYVFLRDSEGVAEDPAVGREFAQDDPAAVITRRGQGGDPLCQHALELFVEIYGAVAANLALLMMARGGVFIAGGIAAHMRPLLTGDRFRSAFERHVRYTELLSSIPRYLITHPNPGLLGAATAAKEA